MYDGWYVGCLETVDVDFFLGFDNAVLEKELCSFVATITLKLNDFIPIFIMKNGTVGREHLSHTFKDLVKIEVGCEARNSGQTFTTRTLL